MTETRLPRTYGFVLDLNYNQSRKDERWQRPQSRQLDQNIFYLEGIEGKFPTLKNPIENWEICYDEKGSAAQLGIQAKSRVNAENIIRKNRFTIENLILPPYARLPEGKLWTHIKWS
jgi:hypothetical protein